MANDVTRRWPRGKVRNTKGQTVSTSLYGAFTTAINKDDAASYGPGHYKMQGWSFDINDNDTITVRSLDGLALSHYPRFRS